MTRARTLADIGDLSAPLTVTTAAQTNITSLGTLTGLSVSGVNLINLIFEYIYIMIDHDGITRHGVMRFRAIKLGT